MSFFVNKPYILLILILYIFLIFYHPRFTQPDLPGFLAIFISSSSNIDHSVFLSVWTYHLTCKLNIHRRQFHVLPSLEPYLIYSFHHLPSLVHSDGFPMIPCHFYLVVIEQRYLANIENLFYDNEYLVIYLLLYNRVE